MNKLIEFEVKLLVDGRRVITTMKAENMQQVIQYYSFIPFMRLMETPKPIVNDDTNQDNTKTNPLQS